MNAYASMGKKDYALAVLEILGKISAIVNALGSTWKTEIQLTKQIINDALNGKTVFSGDEVAEIRPGAPVMRTIYKDRNQLQAAPLF